MLTSSNIQVPIGLLLGIVILSVVIFSLWLRRYRYLSGERPRDTKCADICLGILFLLIFSGPPKLRDRDPLGSIRGDVDSVVLLHLLVWGLAGVWLCYQLVVRRLVERRALLRLWIPQKLGLMLILCLGASALVSPSPALTIFKVYQMLVMLLLSVLFVQRYGADACLHRLFVGSTLLVIAIAVSAIIAPDLVMMGDARLRGDLIAPAGDISVISLILLSTNRQRLSKVPFIILFMLSLVVLILLTDAHCLPMHGGCFVLDNSPAAQASDLKALCTRGTVIIAFGTFKSVDIRLDSTRSRKREHPKRQNRIMDEPDGRHPRKVADYWSWVLQCIASVWSTVQSGPRHGPLSLRGDIGRRRYAEYHCSGSPVVIPWRLRSLSISSKEGEDSLCIFLASRVDYAVKFYWISTNRGARRLRLLVCSRHFAHSPCNYRAPVSNKLVV